MYKFGQEFARAIERRMAWDVMTSMRHDRRETHERLHAEVVALASGEVENPSEFQERLRIRIDECDRQVEALLEAALSQPINFEAFRDAAVALIGESLGRVMSLELRVELLERAVDGR